MVIMSVSPDIGIVGSSFTISGERLPPDTELDLMWGTVDGSYSMSALPENVEFYEKVFVDSRLPLGTVTIDGGGAFSTALTVPEDYGEVHDIYGVIDGQDIAKGGFRVTRNVVVTPTEGPIGTPVEITITGIGWQTYKSTIAIRYDNMPTGIMSAVITRGTATASIRAAGSPGDHVIDVNHGAKSVPYLNNAQSGTKDIPDWRFWFTVTEDNGPPDPYLEWPDEEYLHTPGPNDPMTTRSGSPLMEGVTASVSPSSGPILSTATLSLSGLQTDTAVEAYWVTASGNRVGPRGWHLEESPLVSGVTGTSTDGSFIADFTVPDGLGGWHVIKVVQAGQIVGEFPFFVEHSLVGITPIQVKAGDIFTVQVKGIGWTELDNGVAMTYDNAYIGFACGFNSNGDVTMSFVATGGLGTHLIDLYPMLYQGHGKPPWGYQVPLLTFKQDAPGLQLGYNLPAIRLAIEIVE